MILGSHVSYKELGLLGCAQEASSYGANTFMFYTGAPQNTIRKNIDEKITLQAHAFMASHHLFLSQVICHAPYIINLANKANLEKWRFSISFLKQELKRCEALGVFKMVLHPGSAVNISKEEGLQNIVEGLNEVCKDYPVTILLETMAGKGNECGSTLEEIQYLLSHVEHPEKFGVCLDTCHLSDAGYDLHDFDAFLQKFDALIGIKKIGCVHLNDSKNALGSHKDRHENIGFGTIGFQTLNAICHHEKLKEVPKILETPYIGIDSDAKEKIYPPYLFEIEMFKSNTFYPDLLDKVRSHYKNA